MNKAIICRIKGGLGNQLFCYAAARRLSVKTGSTLIVDFESGFKRDYEYQRKYALDAFNIAGRKANAAELLKPGEPIRRFFHSRSSLFKNYADRTYLRHNGAEFDARLLSFNPKTLVTLDGYWQSENYFADIAAIIRTDFEMTWVPFNDPAEWDRLTDQNSVAIHVRWFTPPAKDAPDHPLKDFYLRAVNEICAKIHNPTFLIFSDFPEQSLQLLNLDHFQAIGVDNRDEPASDLLDFWIMRRCKHFIISDSTFSWWTAWLGTAKDKVVIAPSPATVCSEAWAAEGLLPCQWIKL